jgi:hypothetical protein
VETVAGWIAVGKDKWLASLTRRPLICKQRGVPVDLVEEMGLVFPSFWAVSVGWELHVGLVRVEALGGVVARWEVDICTEWRSIPITVLIREANTRAGVSRVLDPDSMKTV